MSYTLTTSHPFISNPHAHFPFISNARAASIIREALLAGKIGAPFGEAGADRFKSGRFCAQGIVFSVVGYCVFEDGTYHQQLVNAHDNWGRSVKVLMDGMRHSGEWVRQEKYWRETFMALLDRHDPVRAMERDAQACVVPTEMEYA